jgi:hypothetical protein
MPTLVQPTPLKSTISDYEGKLHISIPLERYGLALVVACWLAGWTFGGISIIQQFLQKPNLFEGLWICFWLVSEPFAIYILLLMIGGTDVVLADTQSLIIRREVFGVGQGKEYLLSEIRNLRFQSAAGKQGSKIAFDYGAKTISFGDGVEGGEANQLIALIQQRCNIQQATQSAILTPRV